MVWVRDESSLGQRPVWSVWTLHAFVQLTPFNQNLHGLYFKSVLSCIENALKHSICCAWLSTQSAQRWALASAVWLHSQCTCDFGFLYQRSCIVSSYVKLAGQCTCSRSTMDPHRLKQHCSYILQELVGTPTSLCLKWTEFKATL